MRLPNGYGSVFKVEGRRNPWRAVTAAPERRHVGYYATKKEAVKALASIVESRDSATISDIYERWSAEKYPTLSVTQHYEKAYKRLEPIWNKSIASLKLEDLEKTIAKADCGEAGEFNIKVLLNQLYTYGIKHDFCDKNYATYIHAPQPKPKAAKKPFTKEEIKKLFAHGSEISQMILVSIYSGWRPAELLSYTIDGDLMKGGVKTSAGKDRIVPIHPKIKSFVKEYRITYYQYRREFNSLMGFLGMKHTPHECRHTFISMAKEKELNDGVIKLLVGHAMTDITESVYTHRNLETLRKTIAQVDWE